METRASLAVIQHTSAEYLGLIEDHLEGRQIRFKYFRPFADGAPLPRLEQVNDGLILLGGGPWGSAGPNNVPSLVAEVELTAACLAAEIPVIGIGLGAQILVLAAGGKTIVAPLAFDLDNARRIDDSALNGYLPERPVHIAYMRDDFIVPTGAQVLAVRSNNKPAVFQIGKHAFGFSGHPGFKPAMAEDLVMEFDQAPPDPAQSIRRVRALTAALETDLIPIMTGLVQKTGWMDNKASQPNR